jgi:hypothetical protein
VNNRILNKKAKKISFFLTPYGEKEAQLKGCPFPFGTVKRLLSSSLLSYKAARTLASL